MMMMMMMMIWYILVEIVEYVGAGGWGVYINDENGEAERLGFYSFSPPFLPFELLLAFAFAFDR